MKKKRTKKSLKYSKNRVVLSDTLPYETPLTFSNRYFYRFLVNNKVEVYNGEIRFRQYENKKNIQEIESEEGKIYPVQIDAEWEGAQLQEIETSWLNMLNKEGSQPEKMSFVRFLVGELMKKARIEDRISSLNGIFVQTPKNSEIAGRFINRQNG